MCNASQTAVTSASAASAGTAVASGSMRSKHERGNEAAAAHPDPPFDPRPDRRVREQVERASAAEREGPDGVELLADVPDDGLHREGEEHDADDQREVRVRVHVAGERHALGALELAEHPLAADREEVEVGEPE